MPMVVRKFLGRITDPAKTDLTYEEARDFASNISRLSADEYGRLTPVVAREVASLRATLNRSIADAAAKVGKLAEYRSAMREYAQAMHLQEMISDAAAGVKRALPYATAATAGSWLGLKLRHYLGD
jgi:methyl-accepting chemotaxis protein